MDLQRRLQRFYEVRCPSKCQDIPTLVVKYKNKEKELFRQLTFKYGPEPQLSSAEKTAIQQRTNIQRNNIQNKNKNENSNINNINYDDWIMSLLDEKSLELLRDLDNYNGKKIPQHILDRI